MYFIPLYHFISGAHISSTKVWTSGFFSSFVIVELVEPQGERGAPPLSKHY